MKTIITSVLLTGALFCIAAPENNGKGTKANGKITTTKTNDGKDKTTNSTTVSATKVVKTKKVKKDTYVAPWINNNGGGNTSYH